MSDEDVKPPHDKRVTNAAEQRFSDMEWKAKRYDYLLTNDSEAVWQAERELQVMRERVAELEDALEEISDTVKNWIWLPERGDVQDIAKAALGKNRKPA